MWVSFELLMIVDCAVAVLLVDTFARGAHQSTGFLQSAGSKPLHKDIHGMPRNTSASDVTDGAHKVSLTPSVNVRFS